MVYYERELETIKQNLARQEDFCIANLFKIFDESHTNEIYAFEFDNVLKRFGIYADSTDVYLVFVRYSMEGSDKIGYNFVIFCYFKYKKTPRIHHNDKALSKGQKSIRSYTR